jgi:hypothetical protein
MVIVGIFANAENCQVNDAKRKNENLIFSLRSKLAKVARVENGILAFFDFWENCLKIACIVYGKV